MQNPPPMTKQQIDALTRFLEPFSVPGFQAYLPREEQSYWAPDPAEICAFREVYRVICSCVHPYERLQEDPPDLEMGTSLFKQFGTIEAMETATPNQIRRLLMLCTRGEHFGFLSTADMIHAGVIQAALRRLIALRDAAPDDPDGVYPIEDPLTTFLKQEYLARADRRRASDENAKNA